MEKVNTLLTADEVCELLKISNKIVRKMSADKFITPITGEDLIVRFEVSEVHKYLYSKYNKQSVTISILIPCHNEEAGIRACIESCLRQTRPADQILVVNDGSTDKSGEILATFGNKIQVLTIPVATGNKSFAQERGLKFITGDVFFASDGDTILDEHMLEEIESSYKNNLSVLAVGGYVRSLPFNWITACRELDYIIGQNLHKVAQSNIDALFVIPGCASAFKTKIFKKYITFDHDTLTEDLDFTYKMHKFFFKIAYNTKAIAYTQDPGTLSQYINQMRRWYCGGWQNLRKHYSVVSQPTNSLQLSLTYAEGLFFSAALFLFPLINIKFFAYFFIPYFFFMLILGLYGSIIRRRLDLLLYSPAYLILVVVNSYIFLEQFFKEIVLQSNNLVWFHPDRRLN